MIFTVKIYKEKKRIKSDKQKEKQQLQGMAKQLQVKMAAKRKYRKCRKSRQVAARVHVVYNITPPQRERISLCRLLLCCLLKFSFALCRMNFEKKQILRRNYGVASVRSRSSAEAQQRLSRGSAGEAAEQQQSSSRGLSSAERPLQGALQSSSAQQELSRALQRSVGRKGNT